MNGPDPIDSGAGGKALQNEALGVDEHYLYIDDLPIHKAAFRGDILSLKSLVESVEDIDVRSGHQCTPLHLAIRGNQVESVKILLTAGADPDLLDYGNSAYMEYYAAVNLAAWCGSTQVLEVLIDHGLAIPTLSLLLAASLNRVDCMRTILRKLDDKPFSDNSRLAGVRGTIRRAALCWHAEAVKFLMTEVEAFSDQDIEEYRACLTSALFEALDYFDCDHRCRSWHIPDQPNRFLSMLDSFITNGADVNATDPVSGMNRFWMIAGQALQFDLGSVVCLLLAKGLRVDEGSRMDHDAQHPPPLIDVVARVTDTGPIKAMVAAGANVTAADNHMSTPLHFANTRAIAECLVDLGSDLFAKDDQGRAPLHVACQDLRVEVVDFLVARGADVNETATEAQWTPIHFVTCGEAQWTPIHLVPWEGWNLQSTYRLENVKILINHGADLQATASDGRTALHGVAQKGDVNVVRYLIEQGADVCAAARGGETVLHLICSQHPPNMIPIAELLLDQGAEIEARSQAGATPLYLALDGQKLDTRYNPDFFNMLVRRGADRFASTNAGKRVVDLVDSEDWMFDEAGMLCLEPRR
ncbi:hypothetical protein N0V83_009344 [Neocucurbitaria cava]|uniref:Ankyrin repeat protein n=1 Tax=Neocucurbitaria cava TaxID=798079 RepID=A0A9W8Y0D8_9PLEO|nr:hypothetical protein N0V83_009344 [Neocucurbitaria cava]